MAGEELIAKRRLCFWATEPFDDVDSAELGRELSTTDEDSSDWPPATVDHSRHPPPPPLGGRCSQRCRLYFSFERTNHPKGSLRKLFLVNNLFRISVIYRMEVQLHHRKKTLGRQIDPIASRRDARLSLFDLQSTMRQPWVIGQSLKVRHLMRNAVRSDLEDAFHSFIAP